MSTRAFELPAEMSQEQEARLDEWLRALLWDETVLLPDRNLEGTVDVHRTKGRIHVNEKTKFVQGVRKVFEIFDDPNGSSSEAPNGPGKLVLIGRGLREVDFQKSLNWFVVEGNRD